MLLLLLLILHFLVSSQRSTGQSGDYPLSPASNPARTTNIHFVMDEELQPGARIGSILERLASTQSIEFALTDQSSGAVNFVLLTDERLIFLNRSSGLLTVKQHIDREALCGDLGVCCPGSDVPDSYSQVGNPSCAIRMLVMDQRKRQHPFQAILPSQEQPIIEVVIYVNDLNDNAPSWSSDKLELEIPEHTSIGRTFQLPEAKDPDQGPEHTVQSYQLIPNDPQKDRFSNYDIPSRPSSAEAFRLSSDLVKRVQGMPYKYNLRLEVIADLDREKQSVYYFLLTAVDGRNIAQGGVQMTGTLSIVVKITDINDQAPKFLQPRPNTEINENTPVGSHIFTIVAKDEDPSDANRLVYRLGSAATAEMLKHFAVDSKTGSVTVASEVDFETAPYLPMEELSAKELVFSSRSSAMGVGYQIPIEVSDGAHIAETELRIRVINVNDNPPNISIQSPLQKSAIPGELFIREDEAKGTLVATITVTDADERGRQNQQQASLHFQRDSMPSCSTTNPFFAIHPLYDGARNHFKLVTSRPLDHEAQSSHAISILCHDSGQPSLSTNQHLTVRLEDVNDSPPVFDKVIYYARIAEGLPVHTPILQVHAKDGDTRIFADVRYRLIGLPPGSDQLVLLDAKSGQIRSAAVFDRETMSSFNFSVEAVDCGGNTSEGACGGVVKSATAEVILIIEDMNDCTPEFDQQSYEFVIREGQMSKISVGKVHAVDRDAEPKNNRVHYTISDNSLDGHLPSDMTFSGSQFRPSRVFSITSQGEIFTNSIPMDREQVPIITFSVVCSDNGKPSLSAFATVVIRVEDINDNAPQWIFPLPPPPNPSINMPTFAAASVNISLFSTVGFVVTTLKASDPDMRENGRIVFDILRGNEQGYFALDSASGTLYLAKLLTLGATTDAGDSPAPPTVFALSLKVSDRGEQARSNTSLLRIFILQEGVVDNGDDDFLQTNDGRYQRQFSRRIVDRDLLIMIVMIIITLLVSVLLITAIFFLRCRQNHAAANGNGRENERNESGDVGVRLMGKSPTWVPNFPHDTNAKSGMTLDSNGSSTLDYGASTVLGPFMPDTIKTFDGTYGRFSPAVLVPQHATFQRSDESHPSPPLNVVFSKDQQKFALAPRNQNNGDMSPRLVRLASPNDAAFMTNTLPNNIKEDQRQQSTGAPRCYMTLNPELYEVDSPYGQLKYAGWNLMRPKPKMDRCDSQNERSSAEPLLLRKTGSHDILREPVASSSNGREPQQQPGEQDLLTVRQEPKRCRFNPMPPNIIKIDADSDSFINSYPTEDALDGERNAILPSKPCKFVDRCDPIRQADSLLFDLP